VNSHVSQIMQNQYDYPLWGGSPVKEVNPLRGRAPVKGVNSSQFCPQKGPRCVEVSPRL